MAAKHTSATRAVTRRARTLVVWVLLAMLAAALPAGLAAEDNAQSAEGEAQTEPEEPLLDQLLPAAAALEGVVYLGKQLKNVRKFQATPRELEIFYYPCNDCHAPEFADKFPRKLEDEHEDIKFQHGGGRFWCYDACHNIDNMNTLVSLRGKEVPYDKAYEVCGQCHFDKQMDWAMGGHGKRAGAWRKPHEIPATHEELKVTDRESIAHWDSETVTLLNCPVCHNPHDPAIKPFEPSPAPQVRAGLQRRPVRPPVEHRVWIRDSGTNQEGQ